MIGVIGCGNMSSAVVKGIHHKYKNEKFLTFTPSFVRAEALAREVGGKAVRDIKELANCSTLLIACKPQQFNDLANNLKSSFDLTDKYFISIMAAIPIEAIKTKLGAKQVSRVMPNTPCLFGEGVSLILHSAFVREVMKTKTENFFKSCSKVFVMSDEKSFDQVTTVTGSGPAYVFQFAKTMSDQLELWGIESEIARDMVVGLFSGASKLMNESNENPFSVLMDEVTSKGGVTIEAVKVFETSGLTQITKKALISAFKRSEELTKELS